MSFTTLPTCIKHISMEVMINNVGHSDKGNCKSVRQINFKTELEHTVLCTPFGPQCLLPEFEIWVILFNLIFK